MSIVLTEIDMTKLTKQGGEGIDLESTYLVMICGSLELGTFSKQWFGLSFHDGVSFHQLDIPPDNYSGWQKIWRVDGWEELAEELEPEYAQRRRRYAIDHGLHSSGQCIDESAPIEAFYYTPKVTAMPRQPNKDEEE